MTTQLANCDVSCQKRKARNTLWMKVKMSALDH